MAIDRRRIGAEVATVALVVACLGATLNLVISVHRRALQAPKAAQVAPPPPPEPVPMPTPAIEAPTVVEAPKPAPTPTPEPTPAPAAVEDPTPAALAQLGEKAAKEREEAARLDREAAGLEQARKEAEAGAESWRRREMLVKQQIAEMDAKARMATVVVDAQAARRDVLVRERDALKAAIAAAPGEGSYAVLPYQGENGTWRRPIVIECTGGQVSILPNGPSFSLLELSGLANPRSSPVVVAIARELLKVKNSASPDGTEVTPYFVFVVRPDGVRSYYEARSRLEPLGMAFGYELVDSDMKIHVPDYDNLASWDGSTTLDVPASTSPVLGSGPNGGAGGGDKPGGSKPGGDGLAAAWPNGGGGGDKPGDALAGGGLSWPGGGGGAAGGKPGDAAQAVAGAFDRGRNRGAGAKGAGGEGTDDEPGSFVWPARRPGAGDGMLGGGAAGEPEAGGEGDGPAPLGLGGATRGDSPLAHDVGRGGHLGAAIKPASRDAGRPDFARGGGSSEYDRPGAGPNASAVGGGSARPVGGGEGRVAAGDQAGTGAVGVEPSPGPAVAAPAQGGGLMWGDSAPVGVTPNVADGYRGGQLTDAASGGKPGAAGSPSGDEAGNRGGQLTDAASGGKPGAAGSPSGTATAGKPGSGRATGSPGSAPGSSAVASGSAAKPPPIGLGASGGGMKLPFGLGSSGGQAAPGLMLGGESEASSGGSPSGGAGSGDPDMKPLIQDPEKKRPPAIEVPFEIVVACGRDGVTIQPGNRKITTHALKTRREDELLVRNLEAEAIRRSEVDPAIKPRPRVRFLVQEDGAGNFWEARRQLLFSGLDWPMTLQVAGAQNPRLLDEKGIW